MGSILIEAVLLGQLSGQQTATNHRLKVMALASILNSDVDVHLITWASYRCQICKVKATKYKALGFWKDIEPQHLNW